MYFFGIWKQGVGDEGEVKTNMIGYLILNQ